MGRGFQDFWWGQYVDPPILVIKKGGKPIAEVELDAPEVSKALNADGDVVVVDVRWGAYTRAFTVEVCVNGACRADVLYFDGLWRFVIADGDKLQFGDYEAAIVDPQLLFEQAMTKALLAPRREDGGEHD